MSILVDEGFDGQPLGPFGGGTIVAGGVEPTPNQSYLNAVVFGGLEYDIAPSTDLSVFLSYQGGATEILDLGLKDIFNHVFFILQLIKEQDGSLTALGFTNSGKVANSMTQNQLWFTNNEWVFIHLHLQITPGSPSSASIDVKVNENDWCTGTASGLPNSLFCNYFNFSGSYFASALLDNLTIKSGDDTLPHPADNPPGTPPYPHIFGRLSQLPIEHVDLPNDASVRLSQALVEHIELPNDQMVRVSEMIIEIIQSQAISKGGGWVVKEA